jgi:hypothetical protein
LLIWQTAWLLVIDLAAFGVGWAVIRRVRNPAESTRTEAIAESLVLGMAMLGAATFLLGVCKLLYPWLVVIALLAAAAAGAFSIAKGALSRTRSNRTPPELLAVFGISFLLLLGLPSYLPGLAHDTLVYHFTLPKIYLNHHGMVTLPYSLFANMPHNVELLYVLAISGGGFVTAKLLIFQFSLLTLLGFSSFASRYLSAPLTGVMGLLYLGGPMAQWHVSRAYVEPAVGCFLLYALLAFHRWRASGHARELLLFGVLTGWALGTKYTAWPFASGLILCAFVLLFRERRTTRVEAKLILLTAAALAIPVLPWLIRAWIVTGNPLYPNLPSLLGGKWWSVVQDMQYHRALASVDLSTVSPSVWAWLRIPWNLVTSTNLYSPVLMVLALLAPLLPRSYREGRWQILLMVYPGVLLWALVLPFSRYLLSALPLLVVASTLVLEPMARRRWLWIGVQCAILLTLVTHTRLPDRKWDRLLTENRQAYVEKRGLNPLWRQVNERLPPSAKLMLVFENRALFLDRDFWLDSAYEAPSSMEILRKAGSASEAARSLRESGITHLVVNRDAAKRYLNQVLPFEMTDPEILPQAQFDWDVQAFYDLLRNEATPLFEVKEHAVYKLARPGPTHTTRFRWPQPEMP